MNTEDIVKLMEACKTSGVQRLKYEKLEIVLHPPGEVAAAAVTEKRSFRAIEQQDDTLDEDLQDLMIQSMLIDDPLGYEQERRKEYHAPDTSPAQRSLRKG